MAGAPSRLRQRAVPRPSTSSAPRARRQRKRISYNEDSTDSDDFDGTVGQDDFAEPSATARSRRSRAPPVVPTRTSPRSTRKRKRPISSQGSTVVRAKRQKKPTKQTNYDKYNGEQNTIQLTGRAMPWTTLPYHILASVFAYASHPLVSVLGDPSPSVAWLVQMALLCKAFAEPALSALYFEPPIHAPRQIHGLKAIIQHQSENSTINYRGKIKSLSMGPINGLLRGPHTIESIIPFVPQLRGIALGVHSDDPKLCRLHTVPGTSSSHDDMSILWTMTNAGTRLENWTWNRTLAFHNQPLSFVKKVHQSTPFLTLKSLTFIDFHLPAMVDYNGNDARGEEALADTLSALPSLRKLQFSLADVVNEILMPLLPGNLRTLVLTSCYNLFSPALENFLLAKGQQIRELVLSHNQSLNLSFLTELSHACPRLEILNMNLLYYNSHTTFNDSTPRYDSLLLEGEQPSWPTSLRRLELLQLRRWKTPAAEYFFSSFVDTPRSLSNLRHIEIKASIDESGWRDRIAFRDKWVQRLNEVFLRRSSPPNPHLRSIAAYRDWKAQQAKSAKGDGFITHVQSSPANEASGNAVAQATKSTAVLNHSPSDAPLMKVRRSTRVHPRKEVIYNESDSSQSTAVPSRRHHRRRGLDDSLSEDSVLEHGRPERSNQQVQQGNEERMYVQGLCDVVDVVIDNLRPTEEQLHESDFLDEERSGDEDWNGDDDMDDGRYAW